jgi:hypothetical protein
MRVRDEREYNSIIRYLDGVCAWVWGLIPDKGIFFIFIFVASRPPQWPHGDFITIYTAEISTGIKGPQREADCSPHLVRRSKVVDIFSEDWPQKYIFRNIFMACAESVLSFKHFVWKISIRYFLIINACSMDGQARDASSAHLSQTWSKPVCLNIWINKYFVMDHRKTSCDTTWTYRFQ